MKITSKKTKQQVKASCGKRGCRLKFLPLLIIKEKAEEYKKAS
jgi:hypothetical protein